MSHGMPPEQVQLVREHEAGQHSPIRREGCPICLELPATPAPGRVDPAPWLRKLPRRR